MKYVLIPGLHNSGPEHWQTYWERSLPGAVRIEQEDWDTPKLSLWLEKLHTDISQLNEPFIFIAHSLGVSLVMHWFEQFDTEMAKGAMLVSASDVDSPAHTPDILRNFAPMPLGHLSKPSVLVHSENDPFISTDRAHYFSQCWGSDFISIGNCGHINAESHLKNWEQGQQILHNLLTKIKDN